MSHPRLADRAASALLLIDLQESYRDKLLHEERTVSGAQRLLQAAAILGLPVLVTEQVPDRLGETRRELLPHLGDALRFAKRSFSCLGADGLPERLESLGRRQLVLAGIETHVCVSQTAHDLLLADYQVFLVRDAITSRHAVDDETAFAKMVGSGAVPTSVEAILFEWLRDSRAPEFKAIHQLVR